MPFLLTAPPVFEPLTLDEAKTYLRIDTTDEDTLIQSLIVAARVHVEQYINKKLMTQSWSIFLSQWPDGKVLELPLYPLQAVNHITTYDENGTGHVWSSENYSVDIRSEPGRVLSKTKWPDIAHPTNSIEVNCTVGYSGDREDIPEPLRQAIRHLVVHWYENRGPVSLGDNALHIPSTVHSLLTPYKVVRI